MRQLRNCESSQLFTGVSKCPPDFGKMLGALLVKPGTKLPAQLTQEKLEELVHADRSERIYGIVGFNEFAKNGGEMQTAANGYGPTLVTGVSARMDTFTLDKFYPELDASLTKTANTPWDVYFIDEDFNLHGINDGTDTLAGYPMGSVYSDSTPIPTSSAAATMNVVFCHKNAKMSKIKFDYQPLGFDPFDLVLGLTPVKMGKVGESGNNYKIYEATGGNDVTSIYGPLIAEAGNTVINGTTTAVTYDEDNKVLTIASSGNAAVSLKSPKVLFANDIKGIEQVA